MARILYGVAGEGFGHSSRSHLIGQHLIDCGHEVLFIASRKSLSYLRQCFGANVHEVFGLCLVYQNRNLLPLQTLATNLAQFRDRRGANRELYRRVIEPFDPDVVISDFEPFSALWAWRHGVPLVSINHQDLLTMCEIEYPPGQRLAKLSAQLVTRCHHFGAAAHVILNFFQAPVKHARGVLAPPVVRPIARSFSPSCTEHILIYSTDPSWKSRLLRILAAFPAQQFHIYGFNEKLRVGNCLLLKNSTEGFLRDLASCRGVIATAGFSLISECLHFRKKMLLLPIAGQYEQMMNAFYADKLGIALHRRRLDTRTLGEYLEDLQEPMVRHKDILWPNNEVLFRTLRQMLGAVCSCFEETSPTVNLGQTLLAG
jgi:uncharacterized protein (TIGR00661 family)